MGENITDYDTSDYPRDHYLHSMGSKKVIGKMKDECAGRPILEYVRLSPKMYIILGVQKYAVNNQIRREQNKECSSSQKNFYTWNGRPPIYKTSSIRATPE